jgi:hypothetical protein
MMTFPTTRASTSQSAFSDRCTHSPLHKRDVIEPIIGDIYPRLDVLRPWIIAEEAGEKSSSDDEEERGQEMDVFTAAAGSHETVTTCCRVS